MLFVAMAGPASATDTLAQGVGRGSPFRLTCPPGAFLVGFDGRVGAWVDNFRIVCAAFDPARREMVNPFVPPGVIGTSNGGGPSSSRCPGGWGIGTITPVTTKGDGPTDIIHSWSFTCVQVDFRSNAQRSFGSTSPPESHNQFRPNFPQVSCANGEFANGAHGSSGLYVDLIGLTCAPLPAAPPPPPAVANNTNPNPGRPLGKQQPTFSQEGFTGTWNTRTDKNWTYVITFIQNGREVTGSYIAQDRSTGTIRGRFGANVLDFMWEQQGGFRGTGRFILAADGRTFTGTYNTQPHPALTDPRLLTGSWSGTRR